MFVDRCKDVTARHTEPVVRNIIFNCLKGGAITWLSECSELEKALLRDANLDAWYTTLINRFKVQMAVALTRLTNKTYSLRDLHRATPRSFVQQMLSLTKAAGFTSTQQQLTIL